MILSVVWMSADAKPQFLASTDCFSRMHTADQIIVNFKLLLTRL